MTSRYRPSDQIPHDPADDRTGTRTNERARSLASRHNSVSIVRHFRLLSFRRRLFGERLGIARKFTTAALLQRRKVNRLLRGIFSKILILPAPYKCFHGRRRAILQDSSTAPWRLYKHNAFDLLPVLGMATV